MKTSESLVHIAPALVSALSEIEGASKQGENPAFKRDGKVLRYTTLDAVIEASRDLLAKHDLALMQFPGALADGVLSLETVILHKSGEWVSGDFQIALGRSDPQGVGSALTYARRYAQKAALNMPDLDDDAEAAQGRSNGKPRDAGPSYTQRKSAAQAKRDLDHEKLIEAIKATKTEADLDRWYEGFDHHTATLPLSWLDPMRDEVEKHRNALSDDGVVR